MANSREFTLGSIVNLGTLLVGLTLGFMAGIAYNSTQFNKVFAQDKATPVEEVTPNFTVGTIGTGLILAHQVETDNLVANGFDVMKMQEGILNYLASRPLAERADIQRIVDQAKPDKYYKLKMPFAPAPTPSAPPQNQEKPKP